MMGEIPYPQEVDTETLARMQRLQDMFGTVAACLVDEVQIRQLRPYANALHVPQHKQREHADSTELNSQWVAVLDKMGKDSIDDWIKLSQAFGFAIKAGYESVGQLRQATIDDMTFSRARYFADGGSAPKRYVPPGSAVLLKRLFPREKTS